MTILLKLFAWLLAAAVAFATLGPPDLRPHAQLGQDGEHALAFVLVGLAFGLAYSTRRWSAAMIAVGLIGVLELLQFIAPGRHARLEDFVVDALTACVGFVLSAAVEWAVTRFRSNTLTSEGPAE
ncbi:VanZ family protein [Bradyrhizobium manausense]|uniref:VanZ family protein n=1 Tax=Bradyrhizobium TaxID=374 RepID=UPI001BA91658|nr:MULTISPECIES: VanZ family protein [Bradyrhizobium]MBR0824050.1 VanZ family protein [Bradyrhizobium manausense]UVO26464.1 VanZ family protein [Bradyrhizobium arachidis]